MNKNLVSLSDRTTDEQRAIAQKGGIASGVARRRKRAFRELLESILDEEIEVDGKIVTRKEFVCARVVEILQNPETSTNREFLNAFEIVRNTIGEMPVEKILISEISQDVIDEVEAMVLEEKKGD